MREVSDKMTVQQLCLRETRVRGKCTVYKNKVVAPASQTYVSSGVSDTEGDTCSVLKVVKDSHTFATRDEKMAHWMASAKPLSSTVLLQ